MTKLIMPRIDRKLISKKDYVIGSLKKIIKTENIIDHEDQIRPFETDALTAYKQKPLAVVFPENTKLISYISCRYVSRAFKFEAKCLVKKKSKIHSVHGIALTKRDIS